ncbi:MAG: hypothetical protein GC185_07780 [Alphaproteobacteria bacterium]|nr:hypothetical protein [Alphaproteobacteria bacterium]
MSLKRSFNSVKMGNHVDRPGAGGETYLTRALKMGEHDAMREFLEIGADANACNAKGEVPLHIALERNDLKAINILLRYNASVFFKQDGMTLREHALQLGNKPVAEAARRIEVRFEAMLKSMYYGGM